MIQRDRFASCPRCEDAALDPTPDEHRLGCAGCGGVLVDSKELLAALGALLPASFERPREIPFEAPTTIEPETTCPRCTAAMTKHLLHGIQVDRCAAHGVWFDGTELQAVLEKAHLVTLAAEDPLSATLVRVGFSGQMAANLVRWIKG